MREGQIGTIATIVGVSIAVGIPLGIGLHNIERTHKELKDRLKNLEARQEIRVEDVIGQEAPEKFYEHVVEGKVKRVYLEIDGKPVEEYVRGEQK